MKIIVYSDSHGSLANVLALLEKEKDADFCFFLGDGVNEAQDGAAAAACPEFSPSGGRKAGRGLLSGRPLTRPGSLCGCYCRL